MSAKLAKLIRENEDSFIKPGSLSMFSPVNAKVRKWDDLVQEKVGLSQKQLVALRDLSIIRNLEPLESWITSQLGKRPGVMGLLIKAH